MTVEEEHFSLDNLILKTHVGSRLYGTNIDENPDTDTYGVCIEPPEIALGISPHRFTHYRYGTTGPNTKTPLGGHDGNIVSLRHFMHQCSNGNPDALAVLSLRPQQTLYQHPVWQQVVDHRERLISREIARSVDGFAQGHIRKYLQADEMGNQSTPSRQETVETYGWDTKAAYIALRTLRGAIELMQSGYMQIPMYGSWQKYLLDVRRGEYTKSIVLGEIGGMRYQLQHTANRSRWPEHTNAQELNAWCSRLYRLYWKEKEHGDAPLLTISGKHVDVL